MISVSIAIFFISAAALGLELVLVRAFSIGHWHHFSYLVISIALLGFAAGGTFVSLFSDFFTTRYRKSLWLLALAFAITVPFAFWLCQKVPFDELQLIWDRLQLFYLFAYCLLLFVPFLCAGLSVALAFTVFADNAPRLYFYNMTGSGAGVAAVVALMYGNSPENLLLVISLLAFGAALIFTSSLPRRCLLLTLFCAAISFFVFSPFGAFALKIKISQNKSLVYYKALPDSKTLATRNSPLGRIDCIQAPAIRHFPGLSLAYQGNFPRQILIITDADAVSAINHFDSFAELNCYKYMTSALGYHLLNEPNSCIIGAGGGSDIVQALVCGARKITAVEMNPQVINLVRNQFREFASGLYNRDGVEVAAAEGRNFLQTTRQSFDIINISLLDSFSTSAAGLYALNESHLYTVEAIEQALRILNPHGILSITRMLKNPPRDDVKLLATIIETLRRRGITEPDKHIVIIRSWATITIAACPEILTQMQIENAREFAEQYGFDLVLLPGIKPDEVNRFHKLETPVYYENAQKLLSPRYQDFYKDYAYNIRPATDDRPYFFDFFKWKSLPHMIRTIRGQWLPFSEWGYMVLVATLLQAVVASIVFILLPLYLAKPLKIVQSGKLPVLTYFLLLGFAYMFLEMDFIQKMTMLIGHPVFGVAVTLTGFLLFSGLGSLASQYLFKPASLRRIKLAVLVIVIVGLFEIAILTSSFDWLISFSQPLRILTGLIIIAPLAFFMGMPFPIAIKQLGANFQPLVPWAWGINGFASVTGAVLGTLLAISMGFTALALIAIVCYLLAGIISNYLLNT